MNKKVLVIGLDGAPPELLFKWAQEGKLPNISKFMSEGSWGDLKSTYPPESATAWTTFLTGTNPGKHGIYHFIKRVKDSYDYDFFVLNDCGAIPIWKILNKNGKKVGIMQVPLTFPPEDVDGFMVSGLGTPGNESDFTRPKNLKKTLLDLGFLVNNNTDMYKDGNEDAYLADLYYTEQKKVDATKFLLKKYEWDFFSVVFMGLDQMHHYFWKYLDDKHPAHDPVISLKYKDEILRYYQKMDGWVGDILSDVDINVTVFIMSDHGGGPLYKDINLNYWLRTIGLQDIKRTGKQKFRSILINSGFTLARLESLLTQLKLLNLARKFVPTKIKKGLLPRGDALSEIDWSKTKAFSFGTLGLIYLNVKGRDPEGIVSPGEEYENLRTFLIEELQKLRDPDDGKLIVEKAYRKEEIYHGQNLVNAPDIYVATNTIYREYMRYTNKLVNPLNNAKNIERRLRVSGQHTQNGIIIVRGENIKKNQHIEGAEIVDLASNILYCMGVPVSTDMDGKILTQMVDEDYLKNHEVQYKDYKYFESSSESVYSEEDEIKIKEKLKSLGYIE